MEQPASNICIRAASSASVHGLPALGSGADRFGRSDTYRSTQCSARMISGRLQTLSAGRHSPRQWVDAVRQFHQQCFCLLQFHRHALTPPPFVIRGQPPIALTLRHPSALIAIVLRSNKLQIALTKQPNNNIYERYMSAKNHISFLLSQSRFSSALSYYQIVSPINRTVQKENAKKGCGAPAKTPRLLK